MNSTDDPREIRELRQQGYSSRVLDQDKAHLFGADAFKLRQQDAVSLDIDAHTAIYDGPDTYEEDIDAAMKARIEEDRWS